VETARTAWFMYGFLVFARYGSKTFSGCASRTRQKVVENLVISGLAGWWFFPWGLGAPLVIVQNLVEIASGPNEHALRGVLANKGIDLDDLVVGDNGRTRPQDRMVAALLAVPHRIVWAGGTRDTVRADAAAVAAAQSLGDLAAPGEIEQALGRSEAPGPIAGADFSPDTPIHLLALARDVALASGPVGDPGRDALRAVRRALGVADELVIRMLEKIPAPEPAPEPTVDTIRIAAADDALRAIAAVALGVDVDAPPAEVRGAYERLASALPEGDPEDHLSRLDFARSTLLGPPSAEAWAEPPSTRAGTAVR